MAIALPKLLLRSWGKSWGFCPPLRGVVMAADAKELSGLLLVPHYSRGSPAMLAMRK